MKSDYSRIRYWIDDFGYLWMGPVSPNENLHYGRFHGYGLGQSGKNDYPNWTMERSSAPVNCWEIQEDRAKEIMAEHLKEAMRTNA